LEMPGACISTRRSSPRGATLTQLDFKCCDRHALLPSDRQADRKVEPHAATASISRTHSQCQRGQRLPTSAAGAANIWSSYLEKSLRCPALLRACGATKGILHSSPPASDAGWWSQSGSNRRPQACKASALPTELWPRAVRQTCQTCHAKGLLLVVGREGVEPSTSRLSGVRSNHLSYRPPLLVRRRRRRSHSRPWLSSQ
jgi:hypothetical protein